MEGACRICGTARPFLQSIAGALSLADTLGKCDDQLSRLLIQRKDQEGNFGGFDELFTDIMIKRDELFEAFELRKQ